MRKNTKKVDIIIIAVILLLIAGGILLALLPQKEQQDENTITADIDGDGIITYKDYIGKRIGILTGSSFEEPTFDYLPDSEYLYYDTLSDLILALKQNKIDCFISDEPVLRMIHIEQPEVAYLNDALRKDNYSFAFPKNNERTDHIMEQFNEMLSDFTADGTLEKMKDKWFSEESQKNRVDLSGLTGENGTLNIVTVSTNVPFSMVADGELTGYSIELVEEFCRRYGYDCSIEQTNVSSAFAGISTGIYDMLASCATVTEERKESMSFSEPIYVGGISLAVRSADLSSRNKLTLSDFNGKNIAVQTGTNHDVLTLNKLPDAHISYFNDYTFQIEAVKSGKMDAFVADNAYLDVYMKTDSSVSYLDEPIAASDVGYIFAKTENGKKLCDEVSTYVTRISEDGRLREMYDMWFRTDESVKIPFDTKDLDNSSGTIKMAAEFNYDPLIYMKEGKYAGYELYIIYNFCREYGYGLEIMDMAFDGILPAVTSGVCDIGAAAIEITPEREKSVYFSTPHYRIETVLGVRASDIAQTSGAVTENTPLSYFGEKKIGILTGSAYEPVAQKIFPNAEYVYFDVASDLALATATGKIDGYLMSIEQAETMIAENPSLFWLKEAAEETPYAFAFPKTVNGAALRDKINEFLARIKSDGTMDTLLEKWTKGDIEQSVDLTGFTGENGTLNIACDGTTPPWEFTYNSELTGYEIELVAMFCREYGYTPKFDTMTFSAVIPGIASEKYDMAAANISVTPERAESVYFSDKESGSTVVFVTAAGTSAGTTNGAVEDRPFSYYAENKKIGVITASLYEVMINERYPGSDLYQFNNQADMGAALDAGVIDCFIVPKATAEDFVKQYGSMTTLKEVFTKVPYGFAFEKTADKEKLRDQMNEFLAKIRADGTYDELVSVWFGDDEDKKVVDTSGLTGENGTLNLITTSTMPPYSYIKDGVSVGFEIDIATRYCREYGYALNISTAEFSAIIPAVTTGMANIACANIMITEERAESVNFSDPYYTTDALAVVRTENTEAEAAPGFFESISDSFEKNFIREDRWKLILDGIGTTCLITVLSAVFGSILAFLICMFRRTGSRLANAISNIYVKLLQGTPIVVLLMILYYVVLGKSGLEAVWVAVIGFTLNFGAYASEIMRSGIESIDGGQREAALALGYNENQAFFKFIFPQAAVRFLPVYNGEIVSLLKSTSIVGYIAIQDLTKMSDIIRSRTYEAFFPLIATAIIYFILAWIISLILKIILKKVSPKRKRA